MNHYAGLFSNLPRAPAWALPQDVKELVSAYLRPHILYRSNLGICTICCRLWDLVALPPDHPRCVVCAKQTLLRPSRWWEPALPRIQIDQCP